MSSQAAPVHPLQRQYERRLFSALERYLGSEQLGRVQAAYHFAAFAHAGQKRKSGEPFICHPLAVATYLAEEIRMDVQGIMAALLHDVVEDTSIPLREIEERFGKRVATLVDGVTKLTQLDGSPKLETEAKSLRKMVAAMAQDLRVILIKLSDCRHNLLTLSGLSPEKRWRFAREVEELYLPFAERLGLHQLKLELEELLLKNLHPWRYRVLQRAIEENRPRYEEVLRKVEIDVHQRLEEGGVEGYHLESRPKHIASIYRKIQKRRYRFRQIADFCGIRIITDRVDECYRILGLLHTMEDYRLDPKLFKDYIALPKSNGYRSLHTVLISPYLKTPVEIQIRTWEMHYLAEYGVAAHWLYTEKLKQKTEERQARIYDWLREFLSYHQGEKNSLEFLDNLKIELRSPEIFVFTPERDIVELPKGATVLDFAYAIHTEVGHRCIGAYVDGERAALDTPLQTGQTVEILTAEEGRPYPAWLNYVITPKARSAIRNSLKRLRKNEAIRLGRSLLELELFKRGSSLGEIDASRLLGLASRLGYGRPETLFEEIGLGNLSAFLVAQKLVPSLQAKREAPFRLTGEEEVLVVPAKCCCPIPEDAVVAFAHPGKGIVVHRSECRNVRELIVKHRREPLEIEWPARAGKSYPVDIRIELTNRPGALAQVATLLAEEGINIDHLTTEKQDLEWTVDRLTISVEGRTHLAALLRRLRKLPPVHRVQRIQQLAGR